MYGRSKVVTGLPNDFAVSLVPFGYRATANTISRIIDNFFIIFLPSFYIRWGDSVGNEIFRLRNK